MKNVRKNLREYSRQFEELDLAKRSSANKAVVEARKGMLEEWIAWRARVEGELAEEREELGLGGWSEERMALFVDEEEGGEGGKVVEEIFEEVLEESEVLVD